MEASIAQIKAHLSQVLSQVEKGEVCTVLKHNIPIAQLVPIKKKRRNQTKIGCAQGTVTILGDLTEPLLPSDHWEMLQ